MLKRIQTKHIAHLIMLTFAIASLFNLQSYLDALHHNKGLSIALACALAFSLVVMAGLLSELNWNFGDSKFLTLFLVTLGLTMVSGAIQGSAYAADGNKVAGYLMGFALPGLGELGIALALSAYSRSLDGREVGEAQRQLAIGVRSHLVNAIAKVDSALIEKQVNRAVSTVTKELVDSVVADMVHELRSNRARVLELDAPEVLTPPTPTVNALPAADLTLVGDTTPVSNALDTAESNALDTGRAIANDNKRKKAAERQRALYDILRAEFNGVDSEELNKTALGERLGCTRQTIGADIEALTAQGLVTVNGVVSVA